MKIGLVIPIYNRPEYVKQCFESLSKLTVKPDLLVVVDDASVIIGDIPYMQAVPKLMTGTVYKIQHKHNAGVRQSLKEGIEYCFSLDCDIVVNLDSDAIVKPYFIERLLECKQNCGNIISGFNCITPTNPVLWEWKEDGRCGKAFANGINMCFDKKQYEKYIKPSLAKVGNWDYNTSLACQADNLPFIITVPSVVQHIGIESSMGHKGGDFAHDFKRLSLPDVTLFGIDAHDPKGLLRAAEISQKDIEFGAVDIITERLFTGREAYSRWILKDLAPRIKTSHVLIIHPDGYVLNWEAWNNEWLKYDYIGATWWYKDNMNVGNGGFSLRSKKLCDIMAKYELTAHHPEDHIICRLYRESLEKDFGIKFAPEEIANNFSIEAFNVPSPDNRYTGQFGFHSSHVDMNHLPEAVRYSRTTQPQQQIRQVQTFNRPKAQHR